MAKKNKPTNRFSVDVPVNFTSAVPQNQNVLRWLNIQHTGKPTMPLDDPISEEHKQATYQIHAVRRVRLTFQVKKDGKWSLVDSTLI